MHFFRLDEKGGRLTCTQYIYIVYVGTYNTIYSFTLYVMVKKSNVH